MSYLKDTLEFWEENRFQSKSTRTTKKIDENLYNLMIFCDMNIGSKYSESAAELDLSIAKSAMLAEDKGRLLKELPNLLDLKERVLEATRLNNKRKTFVVLGGNLFSATTKNSSYEQQLETLAELFEPIKDKIILAIDGPQESNQKLKYNLTKELCSRLGISDVYSPNKAGFFNIRFIDKDKVSYTQRNYVSSIKSSALTFGAEGNNAQKNTPKLANIDNVFVTCSNSTAMVCKAVLKTDEKTNKAIKHVTNIAFCSGEKEFKRVPGNKYTIKNYSIGYMFSVSAVKNPDTKFLVSKEGIENEKYKSHINSLYPFYYDFIDPRVISITKSTENLNKNSLEFSEWAIAYIKNKCNEIKEKNIIIANEAKAQIEKASGLGNYFKNEAKDNKTIKKDKQNQNIQQLEDGNVKK